jgi:hypothetical protein
MIQTKLFRKSDFPFRNSLVASIEIIEKWLVRVIMFCPQINLQKNNPENSIIL